MLDFMSVNFHNLPTERFPNLFGRPDAKDVIRIADELHCIVINNSYDPIQLLESGEHRGQTEQDPPAGW